jgi:hypothetical protein
VDRRTVLACEGEIAAHVRLTEKRPFEHLPLPVRFERLDRLGSET